jgi:hypothetical protein
MIIFWHCNFPRWTIYVTSSEYTYLVCFSWLYRGSTWVTLVHPCWLYFGSLLKLIFSICAKKNGYIEVPKQWLQKLMALLHFHYKSLLIEIKCDIHVRYLDVKDIGTRLTSWWCKNVWWGSGGKLKASMLLQRGGLEDMAFITLLTM